MNFGCVIPVFEMGEVMTVLANDSAITAGLDLRWMLFAYLGGLSALSRLLTYLTGL